MHMSYIHINITQFSCEVNPEITKKERRKKGNNIFTQIN